MNRVSDNNIIWGGFKANDGKDIALVDSYYSQFMIMVNPTVIAFSMVHWAEARYYRWKGCDLRYDILGATSTSPDGYGSVKPAVSSGYVDEYTVGYNATSVTLANPKENTLLAALPSEFRNNLRLFSRWIDPLSTYVEEDVNVNVEIEETIDAVTLLAITEVYGMRYAQNIYESNAQVKMEYYVNGNTTKHYKHNDTSISPIWLLATNDGGYPESYTSTGEKQVQGAHFSFGIAPAFKT